VVANAKKSITKGIEGNQAKKLVIKGYQDLLPIQINKLKSPQIDVQTVELSLAIQ
jgi:hypothetical protein